jgi:hypothetical protein
MARIVLLPTCVRLEAHAQSKRIAQWLEWVKSNVHAKMAMKAMVKFAHLSTFVRPQSIIALKMPSANHLEQDPASANVTMDIPVTARHAL